MVTDCVRLPAFDLSPTISLRLEYRSYNRPGESEPHVKCVSPDRKRPNVTGQAIATVMGLTAALSFLLILALMYLPLGALALVGVAIIMRALRS